MSYQGEARAYIEARISVEDRGFSSPCWIWQLGLTRRGYGCCTWGGKHTRSHRVSYLGFVGPIADGLHIDHLCRIRNCCNPAHLEAVTPAENQRRNRGLFRNIWRRESCQKGHRLTDANRYVVMKDGAIIASGCRTCKSENGTTYMRGWVARNPDKCNRWRDEHREQYNAARRARRPSRAKNA